MVSSDLLFRGEKIEIPSLERGQRPYGGSVQDPEVKGQGRQKTLHMIIISIGRDSASISFWEDLLISVSRAKMKGVGGGEGGASQTISKVGDGHGRQCVTLMGSLKSIQTGSLCGGWRSFCLWSLSNY